MTKIKQCEVFPIGQITETPLQVTGEALENTYHLQVKIRNPVTIPESALKRSRKQYNATTLVNYVEKKKQASYGLGLINKDLYASNLNFVFGQALSGQSAILSLYRLKTDDNRQFRERIEKEVVHEVGHVLGLSHCENPKCVMRFSNSLRQVDTKRKYLCQACQSKLS